MDTHAGVHHKGDVSKEKKSRKLQKRKQYWVKESREKIIHRTKATLEPISWFQILRLVVVVFLYMFSNSQVSASVRLYELFEYF
jgi:hypothetical protein